MLDFPGMSFFCPWQDATQEICGRTGDTKCVPGKPGCVLFGKVVFAADEPAPKPRPTRKPQAGKDAATDNGGAPPS